MESNLLSKSALESASAGGADRPSRSVENLIHRTGEQLNHIDGSLKRISLVLERLQSGPRPADPPSDPREVVDECGAGPELYQLSGHIDTMEHALDDLSQLVTHLESI